MATVVWQGSVRSVAQVTTWTFAGTWENDDIVIVAIGSKSISMVTGTTVVNTIVANLATLLNAVTDAEYSAITWSANSGVLTGTADQPGVPFVVTISTTESGGGAADAQTINGGASSAGTTTTAASGPNFANIAGNWVGGSLPADGDTVVFSGSNVDVLYGLDLNAVTPAAIFIDSTYTGRIGLPQYNTQGGVSFAEYRDRYLKFCNSGDATNTSVVIGAGNGPGSGRINLDCGTGQATVLVKRTAPSSDPNLPAFKFLGSHASNSVTVQRGTVGVAFEGGSTATVAVLNVGFISNELGDSIVSCGTGVTLTTINVSGGLLTTRSAITTLNITGGVVEHLSGAVTNLTVEQGTVSYQSSGTVTNLKVGDGGVFDCRASMAGRTVTNLELYSGARWHDPSGTVTATNGYDFIRCTPAEVNWDVVPHRTWTPSSI